MLLIADNLNFLRDRLAYLGHLSRELDFWLRRLFFLLKLGIYHIILLADWHWNLLSANIWRQSTLIVGEVVHVQLLAPVLKLGRLRGLRHVVIQAIKEVVLKLLLLKRSLLENIIIIIIKLGRWHTMAHIRRLRNPKLLFLVLYGLAAHGVI